MFESVLDADERGQPLTVLVEGDTVEAWSSESVASVMLRHLGSTRVNPVSGQPRAPYCMMGVCFECLVTIDGEGSRQGCLVPVREGMKISRQMGALQVTP